MNDYISFDERLELCYCTRSEFLDLSRMDLPDIPSQLYNFTWVKYIDISHNRIKRLYNLPSSLLQLNCSHNLINDFSNVMWIKDIQCDNNPGTIQYMMLKMQI